MGHRKHYCPWKPCGWRCMVGKAPSGRGLLVWQTIGAFNLKEGSPFSASHTCCTWVTSPHAYWYLWVLRILLVCHLEIHLLYGRLSSFLPTKLTFFAQIFSMNPTLPRNPSRSCFLWGWLGRLISGSNLSASCGLTFPGDLCAKEWKPQQNPRGFRCPSYTKKFSTLQSWFWFKHHPLCVLTNRTRLNLSITTRMKSMWPSRLYQHGGCWDWRGGAAFQQHRQLKRQRILWC